jgi:hypothetical protein
MTASFTITSQPSLVRWGEYFSLQGSLRVSPTPPAVLYQITGLYRDWQRVPINMIESDKSRAYFNVNRNAQTFNARFLRFKRGTPPGRYQIEVSCVFRDPVMGVERSLSYVSLGIDVVKR